ncbi:MAG: hypothetical protein R2729_01900 [Bryobacteraceae bacterium]
MDLTGLAILASIFMGLGAASLFIFAVKKDLFRDFENVKYQVFWSDLEELVDSTREATDGSEGETGE